MEGWLNLLSGAAGAALVAGVFSIIQWSLTRKAVQHDKKNEQMDSLVIAARMILYDRIKHLGKSYLSRGWVYVEEMEDLEKMHAVYHGQLGGNGFLNDLMGKVKDLPAKAEK